MLTCKWLGLQTLGFQLISMPKNLPDHWPTKVELIVLLMWSSQKFDNACVEFKAGTTWVFTVGFFIVFKKTRSCEVQQNRVSFGFIANKLRLQGRRCNVHQWWCQLPNVECSNKTMVLFAELGFFGLKPKIQYIGPKKLGFPHPWLNRRLSVGQDKRILALICP